jgi:TRAP-type C4-dicarboxylate transport system permease small subunit
MRLLIDRVFQVTGAIAAFFVFSIFAVMIITSSMRMLGFNTGGSEDIVSWLTAAAAFFGMGQAFKNGDFVRVELLLSRMGPARRRFFELITLFAGCLFTGYISWSVSSYVWDSFKFNDLSQGIIVVPMWVPQLSIVIGSILLFLAFLDEFFRVVAGHKPAYVTAVEERHARGDFSEDV